MKLKKLLLRTFIFIIVVSNNVLAQNQNHGISYVDKKGIIRWKNTETEVKGFGVNYTTPFAHAFRTAKKLGINIKDAIDNDVYHFSRLGFDLYRIHVWDTEISDEEGNLLKNNEHLDALDYLLSQLKKRNINYVITPIAFWGNGWPEPNEDTPGFSDRYGKEGALTNLLAIRAQENYLQQFLNHKNKYTGIAYKNDPNIIAIEISNEPHHKGTSTEVTNFIKKMVTSIKSTGYKKPIFYNISHSTHLAKAYFAADIDGGTFQWYPTGLGFQKELEGNLLPNIDKYTIPFNDIITKNRGAKIVYEFDAADVLKSYMYPVMARSLREAGIQLATQFAYDPTYMAYANTEYNTHYMNLAYTPQKALSLMISSKIFHQLPMNQNQGSYPDNLKFDDFSISYKQDLGVYNNEEEFIYTNHNTIKPKSFNDLKHIAGYGNSKVVKYDGTGAYFIDRLEEGIWRLEIMPDSFNINNPFGTNSLDKKISVINWETRNMSLDLPNMNKFSIKALNSNNDFYTQVTSGSFKIEPGTYLISALGRDFSGNTSNLRNIGLEEFSAPKSNLDSTYVVHEPIKEISERTSHEINAKIISKAKIDQVEVLIRNGNTQELVVMNCTAPYQYVASVPEKLLHEGFLNYQIIVKTNVSDYTFPANMKGNPNNWNFSDTSDYRTRIVSEKYPLYLFNAQNDSDHLVRSWRYGNKLVPTKNANESEFQIRLDSITTKDNENLNAVPIHDYSLRYNFQKKTKGRLQALNKKQKLIINARTILNKEEKLQVALVMSDGTSFGKTILLKPGILEYSIDLENLNKVKTVTLPRPYPSFLSYYFENTKGHFNLKNAESLQFSIGPDIDKSDLMHPYEIAIISVRLE